MKSLYPYLIIAALAWLCVYLVMAVRERQKQLAQKDAEFAAKLDSIATKYDSINEIAADAYRRLDSLKTRDSAQVTQNNIQKRKIKRYEAKIHELDKVVIASLDSFFTARYGPGARRMDTGSDGTADSTGSTQARSFGLPEWAQRYLDSGPGIDSGNEGRLHQNPGWHNPEPGAAASPDARIHQLAYSAGERMEKGGRPAEAVKVDKHRGRGIGNRFFN